MDLIIKNSNIRGKGSYASEDINKGSKILAFTGERITEKEMYKRFKQGDLHIDDPLQINDDVYLILDEKGYLINHSCNPNAGLANEVDLIAIKDISKGEEITYDYSATVAAEEWWRMDCHCNQPNCRKIIGEVSTIPKDQIEKYYKTGGLQTYILKHLKL